MSNTGSRDGDSIRTGIPISDESAFLRKFTPLDDDSRPEPPRGLRRALLVAAKLLAAAAVLTALFLAYTFSRDRALFSVNQVVLEGCRNLDRQDVLTLIHSAFPRNLMRLDINALRGRLEKFSWVRHVTIRKVYPDRLYIKVEERVPVGIARMDKLWLFDADGVFLDEYVPAEHEVDRPVLAGLHDATDPMAADENLERIRTYVTFIGAIARQPGELSGRLSEVDLTDLANLTVIPIEGSPRVLLGNEKQAERLSRFFQIVERARAENGPMAEIDMRFDDRVIVRPMEIPQETPDGTQ
jgi:cell division protein FtsQ